MRLFEDYVAIMCFVAFVMMGVDKWRAEGQKRRIPERTLFLPVLLGGGFGGWLGMWFFRHKTRKPLFAIGIPAVAILEAIPMFIFNLWLAEVFG